MLVRFVFAFLPFDLDLVCYYSVLLLLFPVLTMPDNEEPASQGLRLKLLRQPKVFSGLHNESIVDWLYEYSMIFDSAGVTDPEKAKYLPLYLGGTALLWHKSLSEADKKKWGELTKKMVANFSPLDRKEGIQKELWQRVLLPRERMIDYIYAKLELCRLSDSNMPTPDKITWISRGLSVFYREKVRGLENKTIDEFTKELLELETFCPDEKLLCSVGTDRTELKSLIREAFEECSASGKGNSSGNITAQDSRYRRDFESRSSPRSYGNPRPDFRDQRQFASERSKPRFNGQCWRCGIAGHIRRDCYVNLANGNLNESGTGIRGDVGSRAVYQRANRN